jgi:hypothetical protein
MFLSVGDQCKVEVYDGTGTKIDTKTVTTTATVPLTGTAAVSLAATASGIGKTATVTLGGGYATAASKYQLLKTDDTALTGQINVGSTVTVMFLTAGDQCKVKLYDASGVTIATETVTTTTAGGAPVSGTAAVSLANTASGIGKVATVTLTGYTGAAQYRLLKTDNTALTGTVNVGTTVVVMFLNVGDQCKVEVSYASGVVIDTPTVTTTGAAAPPPVTGTAAVSLANTASGIGKLATVTLTGYTGAAQYRLLKGDNTALTGMVNVGSTVVVMFLNPGDTCKVEVYNGTGVLMDTQTVVTTAAPPPAQTSATVTLANTVSGIGKVATVTLTGFTGATTYRLLKADNTALTGNVTVGSTVVVMFLNAGDTCKVEVSGASGVIETKTVVAQ